MLLLPPFIFFISLYRNVQVPVGLLEIKEGDVVSEVNWDTC